MRPLPTVHAPRQRLFVGPPTLTKQPHSCPANSQDSRPHRRRTNADAVHWGWGGPSPVDLMSAGKCDVPQTGTCGSRPPTRLGSYKARGSRPPYTRALGY